MLNKGYQRQTSIIMWPRQGVQLGIFAAMTILLLCPQALLSIPLTTGGTNDCAQAIPGLPAVNWRALKSEENLAITTEYLEPINLRPPHIIAMDIARLDSKGKSALVRENMVEHYAHMFASSQRLLTVAAFGRVRDNGADSTPVAALSENVIDNRIGIDLRSYGAKGDGVTDDTSSVNAALSEICRNGGTLIVPNLTFKVRGRLEMIGCSLPWRIAGAGRKAKFEFQGQEVGLYVAQDTARGSIEHLTFGGISGDAVYLYDDHFIDFYKNTVVGGGAVVPSIGPQAGLWVQGGADITIEENVFTGNGPRTGRTCTNNIGADVPCPAGYDFVSNFFYFAGNLGTSTTERLKLVRNRVYGSNTTISMVAFNSPDSEIAGNDIDENDAYLNDTTAHAEAGQGYGINVYGNAHVGSNIGDWVSTVLSGDVVTTTLTRGSVIPYVVGQWVCANAALGRSHNTDFDGCYQITSIADSGGSTPSFTWAEVAANDSTPGIDIVNAVPRTTITGNHVNNTAAACIYAQSMIDGHVDDNVLSNCGQMLPTTSIPMAGITVSGATRLTVNNNSINGVISVNPRRIRGQMYRPSGIAAEMSYGSSYDGNTITKFDGDGIFLGQGRLNVVSGNTIDGASIGVAGVYTAPGGAESLLTISHNTVERTTYAGIATGGGVPRGYGLGLILSGNVISGNTSSAPMSYCIQTVSGFFGINLNGNSCDGFGGPSIATGRTIREGISDGAVQTLVTGNTVANVLDYGFLEGGTDAQISENTGDNNNNAFAATKSVRARVFGNVFGVYPSLAGVGLVWSSDTLHFGNQFTDGLKSGTCTLLAGACLVSTHEIQKGDAVRLERQKTAGSPGFLSLGTITPNSSFVVNSSSSGDTSKVFWEIVH